MVRPCDLRELALYLPVIAQSHCHDGDETGGAHDIDPGVRQLRGAAQAGEGSSAHQERECSDSTTLSSGDA